jgi:hypothetical protein
MRGNVVKFGLIPPNVERVAYQQDNNRDPYIQGRLNSIIGPWAKQCNGATTYTTHRNNNVNDR